jgi:sugar lactone lactonase YvrE
MRSTIQSSKHYLGVRLIPFILLVVLTTITPYANGLTLNPGDILVSDYEAFGGGGGVLRVDPVTGAQTVVSSGGNFVEPIRIAISPIGDIFIFDQAREVAAVIRVDPQTGVQTVVSSGGYFAEPTGIKIDPNGSILVVDPFAFPGAGVDGGAMIRVNPMTGAQTVVSSGGSFYRPDGIAVAPNGDIFVANRGG